MTEFEWTMVLLTAAGFLATIVGGVIALTRGVETIKRDTSDKIATEVIERTRAIAAADSARKKELEEFRKEVAESRQTQDRNVGEAVLALRRFIETVEKEMHAIEIWGRDHYVQKPDFERAIDKLCTDLKAGFADVKGDLTSMKRELKEEFGHPRAA